MRDSAPPLLPLLQAITPAVGDLLHILTVAPDRPVFLLPVGDREHQARLTEALHAAARAADIDEAPRDAPWAGKHTYALADFPGTPTDDDHARLEATLAPHRNLLAPHTTVVTTRPTAP